MKKKTIILIIITLIIIIGLGILINKFINNINEDQKTTKQNIELINKSYDSIKKEVENYNNSRKDIAIFINNFYYDTIDNNYSNNLESLKKHDEIIGKITKEVKVLDTKCNLIYNDTQVNKICKNYKNDYEVIINVYINDINNYNNKLNSYNNSNNKELELFKSNYINEYIDYNKDGIYEKKDEVNE